MVRTVTLMLASATVVGHLLLLGGILLHAAKHAHIAGTDKIISLLRKYTLPFMFLISLVAMLGSLFFSDVANYIPCTLCWYQRILMYPQVFILGFDLARNKKTSLQYSFLLSVIGLPIALYHYSLQLFPSHSVFCEAGSISCAEKVTMTFGYITIPLMAATAFALLLLLLSFQRKAPQS